MVVFAGLARRPAHDQDSRKYITNKNRVWEGKAWNTLGQTLTLRSSGTGQQPASPAAGQPLTPNVRALMQIEVSVSGCVNRPDQISVPRFSSLRRVILRAGGFRHNQLLHPSGLVFLHRQRACRKYRYRLPPINFLRSPSCLDTVRLRRGDAVIVQCGPGLYRWLGKNKTCL